MYRNGESSLDVGLEFGVCKRTVLLWARKANVVRSQSEAARMSKKCSKARKEIGLQNRIALLPMYHETTDGLAYIVGVLMGDGYLSKGQVVGLNVTDQEFAQAFASALATQFGRVSSVKPYRPKSVLTMIKGGIRAGSLITSKRLQHRVKLHSVEAAQFLERIRSKDWVFRLTKGQRISWLRGAWDSEGSIYRRTDSNTWVVQFSVKEGWFGRLFARVLAESVGIIAGVAHYESDNQWHISFARLPDVVRFFDIVQPTIQRKRERFEQAKACLQNRKLEIPDRI